MTTAIEDIIIKMLTLPDLFVYGEILSRMTIKHVVDEKEKELIPYAGVQIQPNKIVLYINDDGIVNFTEQELTFLLIHEALHILLRHQTRDKILTGREAHVLANIVQDIIINESILKIRSVVPAYAAMPIDKNTNKPNGCLLKDCIEKLTDGKETYNDLYVFEVMYEWFRKHMKHDKNTHQQLLAATGDKDANGNETIQTGLDTHLTDTASEAEIQGIVENLKNNTAKGALPGNIEKELEQQLTAKKRDYLTVIKRTISNIICHGVRKKTYMVPNRLGIEGLKGYTYKQYQINCLLDTSGSMYGCFDRVLGFLYKNKVIVNMIQCDTQVNNIQTIKNTSKIRSLDIKGLGGTYLQPGIDKIVNDAKLNKFCTLILTDGYCDRIDCSKLFGPVLIISCGTKVPIKGVTSKVKQIIVNADEI